jgi:hypothetical protein
VLHFIDFLCALQLIFIIFPYNSKNINKVKQQQQLLFFSPRISCVCVFEHIVEMGCKLDPDVTNITISISSSSSSIAGLLRRANLCRSRDEQTTVAAREAKLCVTCVGFLFEIDVATNENERQRNGCEGIN